MSLGANTWRDSLDQRLADVGQTVTITRTLAGGATLSCNCLSFARTTFPQEDPKGLTASQISSPLSQPDQHMIISGTELDAYGWPLIGLWPMPQRGDGFLISGVQKTVQIAIPIVIGDTLARIELTVRG